MLDYGEKENHELAERFGLTKEDFPAYKLFIQGRDEPATFTGDVKSADAIKRFIMKESGNKNRTFFTLLISG